MIVIFRRGKIMNTQFRRSLYGLILLSAAAFSAARGAGSEATGSPAPIKGRQEMVCWNKSNKGEAWQFYVTPQSVAELNYAKKLLVAYLRETKGENIPIGNIQCRDCPESFSVSHCENPQVGDSVHDEK
jgi:hypothetical protein